MNILMVITVYLPSPIYGGPSTVAHQQVKELVKRGHKVTVVTSNIYSFEPKDQIDEKVELLDDVEVYYFKSNYIKPKFSFIRSKSFNKWFKENVSNYDLIHIHFGRELMPINAAKIAKDKGVPYYLQTHGMLNNQNGLRSIIDKLATKELLKSAKGVLVLQETEKALVHKIEKNIQTIILPNGIETSDSIPNWNYNHIFNKKILFLARLHPRKRVLDFIEMANILTKSGISLNYRIVGPDDGDLNEAQTKVKNYGINRLVKFIGAVSREEAFREYANSSIYVLPSEREPFPMSVLEALNVGIPSVVTTGVHNQNILESYNSVVIAEPSPHSLSEAVISILNNEATAKRLSLNGKKLIKEKLSIHKVINQLEQIYLTGVEK